MPLPGKQDLLAEPCSSESDSQAIHSPTHRQALSIGERRRAQGWCGLSPFGTREFANGERRLIALIYGVGKPARAPSQTPSTARPRHPLPPRTDWLALLALLTSCWLVAQLDLDFRPPDQRYRGQEIFLACDSERTHGKTTLSELAGRKRASSPLAPRTWFRGSVSAKCHSP